MWIDHVYMLKLKINMNKSLCSMIGSPMLHDGTSAGQNHERPAGVLVDYIISVIVFILVITVTAKKNIFQKGVTY